MDDAWKTLKIGAGGFVTGIDIAPDGTMVVRTDTYGGYIWRARSVGATCHVESMPVDQARGAGVFEIRIAPSDSNIIYMVYWGDIYKSIDKGQTWSVTGFQHVDQDPNGSRRTDGQKMAVDPNNPNVVYAGTENDGLFVTRDGGNTWQQVTGVPESGVDAAGNHPGITGIVFDPSSNSSGGMTTIYAASYGNGVYHSTDGGTTWTSIPGGPHYVEYAAIDADGNYYATALTHTHYGNSRTAPGFRCCRRFQVMP